MSVPGRWLWLSCLALLLQGCLQVELGGPVENATVSIVKLRSGEVIQSGLRTKTTSQRQADYSAEQWSGFSARVRMLLSGTIDLSLPNIDDNTYYLVTAQGGRDLDNAGSGQPAATSRVIAGQWHAIVTGAQLKGPLVRVNALTESIYQSVKSSVANLDDAALGRRLDEYAQRVLNDVNFDGERNYADVLIWSNLTENSPYKGNALFVDRMINSVTEGHSSGVITDRGSQVVFNATWHVARPQGPFAKELIPCAAAVIVREICTFSRMPMLSAQNGPPSVEAIMQRVIVSHDWMAQRFESMLHEMPEDVRTLMGSLTTIAIGADIRPSYYWGAVAGIYLDAGYVWITGEEYDTISKEEDYRAAFSRQMTFLDLFRYVKNNQRAYDAYSVDGNGNRDAAGVRLALTSLLFHELAHANDYFPAGATLPMFSTPYDELSRRSLLSDQLQRQLPLRSAELVGIGQVLYKGAPPTPSQRAINAASIGNLFAPDGASDLYAYSDSAEDFAMLFEESMMRIHYGFEREIAFANYPADASSRNCADYIIDWGVRGRVGRPQVRQRAQWVVNAILPQQQSAVAAFPTPTALPTGRHWCEHLLPLPRAHMPAMVAEPSELEPVRRYHHYH